MSSKNLSNTSDEFYNHNLHQHFQGPINKRFSQRLFKLLTAAVIFSCCVVTNSAFAAKHIIMPQFGKVDLDSTSQTSSRNFQSGSSSFFGFEYEARILNDISLGGQFLTYKHKYKVSSSNYTSKTQIGFFNIKKYFDTTTGFSPFIGMGPGFATVSTGEIDSWFSNDFDGQVFKAMVGFAYDVQRVGFYLEYNQIFGEVDGNYNDTIDIDSSAFIGGMRVIFGR